MKLTAQAGALAALLGEVSRIADGRSPIPIIGAVLLDARDGALTATCTDLDMMLTGRASATIDEEGKTCVSADQLSRFIGSLPGNAQVEITESNGRLTAKSGRARIGLAALSADEFPLFDSKEASAAFAIAADDLRGMIDRAAFAVSSDSTRPYLNGIFLHKDQSDGDAVLRVVATDGHRLSRVQIPAPEGGADMPGVIVPRGAIAQIRRLAATDGEIKIEASDARLTAIFPGDISWRLSTKLIDGIFPDYNRVIPPLRNAPVLAQKAALLNVIKRVSIAAESVKGSRGNILAFELSPGGMLISGGSAETSDASEAIDIAYDGPPLRIGFNSRIMVDCLDHIPADEIEFHFGNEMTPVVLIDPQDRTARVIAVPYRV